MVPDAGGGRDIAVIPFEEQSDDTAQTEGLPRQTGIDSNTADAESIWLGWVTGEPGMDSGPHHHGEAETAAYCISGRAQVFYGENYDDKIELSAGDFCYIPPNMPHVERNPSDSEPVEFVTTRTPGNVVVNLDDDPDLPPR